MLDKKKFYEDAVGIALLGVVVTLPYSIRSNSLSIILLAAVWLAGFGWANSFRSGRNLTLLVIFIAYYLLFVAGHFYSDDTRCSLKELETKASLLLFPVLFYTIPGLSEKRLRRLLVIFVITCLVACFYCVVMVLFRKDVWTNGFALLEPWDFINHNFTEPIDLHPLYLSCYLNFSLVITFWLLLNHPMERKHKTGLIVASIFLILFNLLALSRMGVVVMMLLLAAFLVYMILRKGLFKMALLCFMLLIGLSGALYFFNFTFRQRIDVTFSPESTEGSLNFRREIWHSSVSLYEKNWAFGVGTGDTTEELAKEYQLNHYTGEFFNCHNEYLQTGISVGLPGIMLLLASLITPFFKERKNILYLSFLIILALSFLTESMLSVQKGTVFYSFFNALFAFGIRKTPGEAGGGVSAAGAE